MADVVLSQPRIEISYRNLAGIDFHLLKEMPSLNLNPEVHVLLYGGRIEISIWRLAL